MRGGWLHTGDIGMLDAEGNLTILDRLTDMVICGGENIYCAEVEAAFQHEPAVAEAAAFGVPDPRTGERLIVTLCARADATIDVDALRAALVERLADYKRPSEILVVRESLPRNAVGKVDKRVLRAAYSERSQGHASA
jgi:acyl-CoA synthetase (AMP-forming)/AMP-acid ligase II